MTESIRYSLIGHQDISWGTGTFNVTLADGSVVALNQVDAVAGIQGMILETFEGSLSAAVTEAGSAARVIAVNRATTVSADLTVPSTCTLWIFGDGIISVATGKTLTINGQVQDTRAQIFTAAAR